MRLTNPQQRPPHLAFRWNLPTKQQATKQIYRGANLAYHCGSQTPANLKGERVGKTTHAENVKQIKGNKVANF